MSNVFDLIWQNAYAERVCECVCAVWLGPILDIDSCPCPYVHT